MNVADIPLANMPHAFSVIVVLSIAIAALLAVVMFKKKLFLMAPLHHHFEKLGWHETDIVKMFWTIGIILTMAGIYFGIWL